MRVATVEKDGQYTIALVNVTQNSVKINIQSSNLPKLENVRQYNYVEGKMILEGDYKQHPNIENLLLDCKIGHAIEVSAASFVLLTNMGEVNNKL